MYCSISCFCQVYNQSDYVKRSAFGYTDCGLSCLTVSNSSLIAKLPFHLKPEPYRQFINAANNICINLSLDKFKS